MHRRPCCGAQQHYGVHVTLPNRYLDMLNWQLSSITFFVQKMTLFVVALNILLSDI